MKTHRGAAKRFRVTGTGKVMRRKATGNHFLIEEVAAAASAASPAWKRSGPRRKTVKRLLGQ